MIKSRDHKPSATCLTGVMNDQDLMHHFKKYEVESRINKFSVEDYYFVRNQLALKKDLNQPPPQPDLREVIHVMIDHASLLSLGRMDETGTFNGTDYSKGSQGVHTIFREAKEK